MEQFFQMLADNIYAIFVAMPMAMRNAITAILVGYGIGNFFYLIASALMYQIARLELRLNQKRYFSKKNKGELLKVGEANVSHPVFTPDVSAEEIWGIATYNWNMFFIVAVGIGVSVGMFAPGDQIMNMIYGIAVGFGGVYGTRMFITYINKLKTTKATMEMMNLLQNEIVVQHNSLSSAMNHIRASYFNHVTQFGEKSWYYKNYPLSRLVYLISVTPSYIPSSLLKQLGDELGEVDALRKVMSNALGRIGQTGDAGTVLKEMIENFNKEYVEHMKEQIPLYSDKLFYPMMITHFLPFMIVILWPIVEQINAMMMGDSLSPAGMNE